MAATLTRFDTKRFMEELGSKLQRHGYAYKFSRNPTHENVAVRWIYEWNDGNGNNVFVLFGKFGDNPMVSFQYRHMDGRTVMFFQVRNLMEGLKDPGSDLNRYVRRMTNGTFETEALIQIFANAMSQELVRPRPE